MQNQSFTLDNLVRDAWNGHLAEVASKKASEAEMHQVAEAAAIDDFAHLLKTNLGEVYDLFAFKFVIENGKAKALFSDGDPTYTIRYGGYDNLNRQWLELWNGDMKAKTSTLPDNLPTQLPLFIGQCRADAAEAAQKAQERQQADDERKAKADAAMKAARSEDAQARALIDSQRARFRDEHEFDLYPIVLYRLTYTAAKAHNRGGRALLRHLWSESDQSPSSNVGYYFSAYSGSRLKEIKLIPEVHAPVWERMVIQSVDDLPEELVEKIKFSVKGVDYNYYIDEELYHFSETGQLWFSEHDVRCPVQWVRDAAIRQSESVSA